MNTQQNSQPAAISNSHSFNVSLFNNKNDNVAKPEKHSWDSLVEILKKPDIRNHKDGRLISGATFEDFKRSKSNAIESSLLILDYDHVDNFDLSVWENMGISFACYTTFSHATNDKPCAYRVIIPLLNPIPADKYPLLYQWAFEQSSGLDANCKDISRMQYLPACPKEREKDFNFFSNFGTSLDWQSVTKPLKTIDKPITAQSNVIPISTQAQHKNSHKQKERDFSAWVESAINAEIEIVRNAANGTRNATLNTAAFRLGQIVATTWANANQSIIESLLLDAALASGLEQSEAKTTIASGLESGKLQPREIPESTPKKTDVIEKPVKTTAAKRQLIKGRDLMKKEFKPVDFIVASLIPESSLNLLVAPPKVGKSWLAMDLGLGVALGGKALGRLECIKQNVLYLSLDSSNEEKLQGRLRILEIANNAKIPDNYCFLTSFSQGKEAIIELLEIIKENDFKFVVIDILHNLKSQNEAKSNSVYNNDYDFIRSFRTITEETGCAILFVHHTNKGKHDDALNQISGSNGLSGSVDNTFILNRTRGSDEGKLMGIGRDLPHDEPINLKWHKEYCIWSIIDNKSEPLTALQQTVLNAVTINFRTAKAIAEYAERSEQHVRNVLHLLTQRGYIKNVKRGEYEEITKSS